MKNGVATVFVCGAPRAGCTTASCRFVADTTCKFALEGKKQGQLCGRAICTSCVADGLCPSHKRLVDKRRAL